MFYPRGHNFNRNRIHAFALYYPQLRPCSRTSAQCCYQLRFRYPNSGGERNMYVDRSRGWMKRQRLGLTTRFFCAWNGREEGRRRRMEPPPRDRDPLGIIGSLAMRGINILDTSSRRGNAFVTPGTISWCPFLHIYLSFFSLFPVMFPYVLFPLIFYPLFVLWVSIRQFTIFHLWIL